MATDETELSADELMEQIWANNPPGAPAGTAADLVRQGRQRDIEVTEQKWARVAEASAQCERSEEELTVELFEALGLEAPVDL